MFLRLESLGEILKCDHSNESYWAVLSCGTVYYVVQGGSVWPDHSNKSYWAVLPCGTVYYVVSGSVNFESANEILECVSCGTVYNQTGYVKNNFIRETVLSVHMTRENELHSLLHVIMTMNNDDDEKKKKIRAVMMMMMMMMILGIEGLRSLTLWRGRAVR